MRTSTISRRTTTRQLSSILDREALYLFFMFECGGNLLTSVMSRNVLDWPLEAQRGLVDGHEM
jgi:hypothetical protein